MSERQSYGCMVEDIQTFDKEGHAGQMVCAGDPLTISFLVRITEDIFFDPIFRLSLVSLEDTKLRYTRSMGEDGWDISWLPRGTYPVEWQTPRLSLPPGEYRVDIEVAIVPNGQYQRLFSVEASTPLEVRGAGRGESAEISGVWRLSGVEGLSWRKGRDNWFFKHFEHAARVILYYMLDDSPLLKGKILDVGCGEGITDLGVFLRKRPELLVGIDLEGNFRELPRMMRENGLSLDALPENLIFRQLDANRIPYPNDYFDVVLSWASLEHLAGGHWQTLQEIKRVLKDGGLFFVHPGLYYANFGHHLGEFTSEPFVHLQKTPEELKQLVFAAQPNYMDRGGLTYAPADFWRYYSELNKITVSSIEHELRALNFEFKKVAVRTEDLVTYTPELQKYPLQDLTTLELYMTVINRKKKTVHEEAGRFAEASQGTKQAEVFNAADGRPRLRRFLSQMWKSALSWAKG
ncbi:MAG: methyltransferase domain-containing protein [Deltaproteobacteria bacterium]|nr:methyltransferase domain-containing protein [Deltaproteobacteria bacterium]